MGAKDYAMRIWLDPNKLHTYGLSVAEVTAAIKAQNAQVAIGQLGGAPSIKAGNRGQLQLFLGGALPFYIPGMITEVQYQSAVAGAVEYQFTVELDHNAIAVSGSYQYPA